MSSQDRLMAAGMPGGLAVQIGSRSAYGLVGTGGTKATAVALTGTVNILATVASAGVAAFQLPPAEASPEVVVENDGASSALVFASGTTDTINALSAGASFSVTNAKRAVFYPCRKSATVLGWVAVLSA